MPRTSNPAQPGPAPRPRSSDEDADRGPAHAQFQRRREDFECLRCGRPVAGNGYTNHCPGCLWSRHVDVNPGDRRADCGGAMEPVRIELKRGEHVIVHRCIDCGFERRNRRARDDSFDALVRLSVDPR